MHSASKQKAEKPASSKTNSHKMKQTQISFLQSKTPVTPTFIKIDKNKTKPGANGVLGTSPQSRPSTNPVRLSIVKDARGMNVKKKIKKVLDKTNNSGKSNPIKSSSNKKHVSKINGSASSMIQISDDDGEEDIPLSVLKNKISPRKKVTLTPTKVIFPEKLNPQNVKTVTVSPVKAIPLSQVKLTASNIQKLLPNLKNFHALNGSRVVNPKVIRPQVGSIPQTGMNVTKFPSSSTLRPVLIVPAKQVEPQKNVVIAIDMDPNQWKKLSVAEQQKIIAAKRAQSQQKFFTIAIKNPSYTPTTLAQLASTSTQQNKIISQFSATAKSPRINQVYSSFIPSKQVYNSIGGASVPTIKHIVKSNNATPIYTKTNNATPSLYNKPNGSAAPVYSLISEKRLESDLFGMRPLPRLKKVQIPLAILGKGFGDLLMVTEFVNVFKKFLVMEEEFIIVTDTLLLDVAGQKESESVLKILLYFLKVLLGNETQKIKGLKVELADLPLTEFTVSFLVEQFLKSFLEKKKKQKRAEEIAVAVAKIVDEEAVSDYDTSNLEDKEWVVSDDNPFDDDYDDEQERQKKKKSKKSKTTAQKKLNKYKEEEISFEMKLQTISHFLEKNEFHQLHPMYQIQTMTFLMNLILESEEFLSYQDDLIMEKVDALRALELYRKTKRDEKMAELLKEKSVANNTKIDDFVQKLPNPTTLNEGVSRATSVEVIAMKGKDESEDNKPINAETKSKSEDSESKKVNSTDEQKKEETKEDPFAGMTQRQIQAIKTEAKQNEEKRREEIRLAFEKEKEELRKLVKKVDETNDVYKKSQRLDSLGQDRSNRSYWLLSNVNPGLYVNGYEDWFLIDDVKILDEIINNLSVMGIREDKLRRTLKSRHKDIVESIKLLNSTKPRKETTSLLSPKITSTSPEDKNKGDNKVANENKETASTEEKLSLKQEAEKTKVKDETPHKEESLKAKKEGEANTPDENKEGTSTPKQEKQAEEKTENKDETKEGALKLKQEGKAENTSTPEITEGKRKTNEKANEGKKEEYEEDTFPSSIEALKFDLFESSSKIVQGNLGVIPDYDQWTASLTAVTNLNDIKSFVSSIQKSIFEKSLLSPFKGFDPAFSTEWLKAVENSETLSKLHTLYGILENSVSWERSSEALRCNVCRRKQGARNSTPMVLCDACQKSYHLNCVRPALSKIPQNVWICPKCMPKGKRGTRRIDAVYSEQNLANTSFSTDNDDADQSDHEDLCHVCSCDGMMILCDTCPLSFHFECHDPPLRRAPKGAWSCFECRKGNFKKMLEKKGKLLLQDSDKDETASDSDIDAFVTTNKTNNRKLKMKNCKKNIRNDKIDHKHDNDTDSWKAASRKRKQIDYKESVSEEDSEMDRNSPNNKKSKPNKSNNKPKRRSRENDWDSNLSSDSNALSLSTKRPRYAKDSLTKNNHTNAPIQKSNKSEEIESPKQKTIKSINGSAPRNEKKDSNNKNKKSPVTSGRGSRDSRRAGNYELKACRNVLVELRKDPDAVSFRHPVNRREVPGYYSVIEKPMDLNRIMEKLDTIQYEDVLAFVEDVELVFKNCRKYNKDSSSEIRQSAERLHQKFEALLQEQFPGIKF